MLVGCVSLHGQDGEADTRPGSAPPPKEPMVTPMGGRCEYVVRLFHSFDQSWERNPKWQASSAVGRTILIEAISLSMDASTFTTVERTKWTDGKEYVQWFWRGNVIAPRSDNKGYYLVGNGAPPSAFPELGWVRIGNYKGVMKFGEKPVHVFRESIVAAPPAPKAKPDAPEEGTEESAEDGEASPLMRTSERVAYLDAKTQLPILSNDGQVIRVYAVAPTPADKLMPPADLVEMLKKREAILRDRVALPGE